jgi:ABC-2 type transport system ATP-binding protein
LRDAGKTILLTTHYMFEADELCGRVAVITGGRIVASGTPAALKAGIADRTVIEVEAFGVDQSAIDRIGDLGGVTAVTVEAREQAQVIVVQSKLGAQLIQPVLNLLEGVSVTSVTAREPTLEDAYVALVES